MEIFFLKVLDITIILSTIVAIGWVVGMVASWLGDLIRNNWTPKF